MNRVVLTGRLTKDPEVRYTDGGLSIARFNIAVNRRFKSDNQPDADFPSCLAFGKTAEFIEKYFNKGKRIELEGRIQTGSYTKDDGTKIYTTEVLVENVEFGESKNNDQSAPAGRPDPNQAVGGDGWMNVPDGIGEDDLPFN